MLSLKICSLNPIIVLTTVILETSSPNATIVNPLLIALFIQDLSMAYFLPWSFSFIDHLLMVHMSIAIYYKDLNYP
jgi:hypothetical protein